MKGTMTMVDYEEGDSAVSTTAGKIFNTIRNHGPLYANDIVKRTGLAKSTVSEYLDRLMSVGLLRDETQKSGKRKKLKVAESAGYVVGVMIGQTKVHVALCDLEAEIIDSLEGPIDLLRETPESILGRVIGFARELEQRAGLGPSALFGLGVGLPCPVDYVNGVPVNPPVMPGWDRFPVARFLAQEFTCPVFVDNDVNVMTLAERDKGKVLEHGHRNGSFMLVKAGTGIGAGLVIDGELYRGAKGAAGDIGHIGIDGDATACRCGNTGCLEAIAGGRALVAKAEMAARSGKSPFLAEALERGGVMTPTLLAHGAASGDEECIRFVISSGTFIGDVLAKLVNFFNPEMIIISGGLTCLGERFIASIREAVYRRSTPLATSDLIIKQSSIVDSGGMIGAAVLVLDEVFSHKNVGNLMRGHEAGPPPELE